MSVDYSAANLRCAEVVVRAMWRAVGEEPLGVQLANSPADRAWVWQREARRYLLETYRRRQAGLPALRPADLPKLQDVPQEWDELAGDRPGEDAHVPTKKSFYCDASLPFSVVAK